MMSYWLFFLNYGLKATKLLAISHQWKQFIAGDALYTLNFATVQINVKKTTNDLYQSRMVLLDVENHSYQNGPLPNKKTSFLLYFIFGSGI